MRELCGEKKKKRKKVTSVDAVGVEGWEMGREVTEERRSPVYYTAVVSSKQFPKR
jgi:hypothetical protein